MTGLDRKTLEDLYDLKRAMLRPDYSRLEEAHHIRRHPETYEVSWPPTGLLSELERLGLIDGVVLAAGIEPTTSSLQEKRSAN